MHAQLFWLRDVKLSSVRSLPRGVNFAFRLNSAMEEASRARNQHLHVDYRRSASYITMTCVSAVYFNSHIGLMKQNGMKNTESQLHVYFIANLSVGGSIFTHIILSLPNFDLKYRFMYIAYWSTVWWKQY